MGARRNKRTTPPSDRSTRDRIIAAAEELFSTTDIDKVNVADIADSAGVHRVTVYRYFPDRFTILNEVVQRLSLPVFERAASRLAHAERFPDDLAYAMVAAIDETRRVPGLVPAMALRYDGDTFKTAGTSRAFVDRAVAIVKPHLQAAQQQGKMRRDLSVDDTVEWLLHVCLSWLFFATNTGAARLLKVCNEYVMPALVTGVPSRADDFAHSTIEPGGVL